MPDDRVALRLATAGLAAGLLLCAMARAAPAPGVTPSRHQPLSPDQAQIVLDVLSHAEDQGLGPTVYAPPGAAGLLASADPAARERAAAEIRQELLAYARAEHGGRVARAQFADNWAIRPAPYDPEPTLDQALAQNQLAAWLAGLAPPFEGYARLVDARRRYAAIASAGGWPQIPAGPPLKLGATGDRVEALRQRLAVEDPATPPPHLVPQPPSPPPPARKGRRKRAPAPPPSPPPQQAAPAPQVALYDQALADAVSRAQTRFGLNADGAAGASTLAALNTPAAQRLGQIDANLERWRWLSRDLPADRLEVNIPAATLEDYEGGKLVLAMRAIVGKPKGQTPSFVANVQAVIFDPPWNVPSDIARKEIWPKERRHPGYMAHEQIFVKANGELEQRPGPKNALGLVKFDLPNPFTVYLHDTPYRSLFAQDVRTLSHGCMRLERPYDLAKRLLKGDSDWPDDRIEAALHGGQTLRVALPRPVPVFVVYRSAFVDGQGRMNFRPDVYGWDQRLLELLAPPNSAALNLTNTTSTTCSRG